MLLHIRLVKSAVVFSFFFLYGFFVFNNLMGFKVNQEFVEYIFSMKSIENPTLMWRSIQSHHIQNIAYWIIIAVELSASLLCLSGFYLMIFHLNKVEIYNKGKCFALYGILCGFLLFSVGFTTIGCEWFYLWMSHSNLQIKSLLFSILSISGILFLLTSEQNS